jgi:hypothetical protein
MEIQNEQIAPEIIQAIIAQTTARGLSINDYLRLTHGLPNGTKTQNGQSVDRPFYETATPEEWVREFTRWAESHGSNPLGLT